MENLLFYIQVIMQSLRIELMSYLPARNYDIKALQHTSGKLNLLHSLFKICSADIWVKNSMIPVGIKIVHSQRSNGPNLTIT